MVRISRRPRLVSSAGRHQDSGREASGGRNQDGADQPTPAPGLRGGAESRFRAGGIGGAESRWCGSVGARVWSHRRGGGRHRRGGIKMVWISRRPRLASSAGRNQDSGRAASAGRNQDGADQPTPVPSLPPGIQNHKGRPSPISDTEGTANLPATRRERFFDYPPGSRPTNKGDRLRYRKHRQAARHQAGTVFRLPSGIQIHKGRPSPIPKTPPICPSPGENGFSITPRDPDSQKETEPDTESTANLPATRRERFFDYPPGSRVTKGDRFRYRKHRQSADCPSPGENGFSITPRDPESQRETDSDTENIANLPATRRERFFDYPPGSRSSTKGDRARAQCEGPGARVPVRGPQCEEPGALAPVRGPRCEVRHRENAARTLLDRTT